MTESSRKQKAFKIIGIFGIIFLAGLFSAWATGYRISDLGNIFPSTEFLGNVDYMGNSLVNATDVNASRTIVDEAIIGTATITEMGGDVDGMGYTFSNASVHDSTGNFTTLATADGSKIEGISGSNIASGTVDEARIDNYNYSRINFETLTEFPSRNNLAYAFSFDNRTRYTHIPRLGVSLAYNLIMDGSDRYELIPYWNNRLALTIEGGPDGGGYATVVADPFGRPYLDTQYLNLSNFTVEAYFKTDKLCKTTNMVIYKGDNGNGYDASYQLTCRGSGSNNSIRLQWGNGSTNRYITADICSFPYDDDQWHHAAFTVNQIGPEPRISGTVITTYCDGELTNTYTSGFGYHLTTKYNGTFFSGGGITYYNNSISNFAIWDIVLSAEQIAEKYYKKQSEALQERKTVININGGQFFPDTNITLNSSGMYKGGGGSITFV